MRFIIVATAVLAAFLLPGSATGQSTLVEDGKIVHWVGHDVPGGDAIETPDDKIVHLVNLLGGGGGPAGCSVSCGNIIGDPDTCSSGRCTNGTVPCCYCRDEFPLGTNAVCTCIKPGDPCGN